MATIKNRFIMDSKLYIYNFIFAIFSGYSMTKKGSILSPLLVWSRVFALPSHHRLEA